MGNIFQIRQTSVGASARPSIRRRLDAYLLDLAKSKLAIEAGKAQIEKDIEVMESSMPRMGPDSRELLQQQLIEVRNQLAFATFALIDAERLMLAAAPIHLLPKAV